jgi:hypothetical protein
MAVWTIAAEEGAGGARGAAELAAAAGVPLFDRERLGDLAHALRVDAPDLAGLEERVGGRATAFLLSIAMLGPAAEEAFSEFELRQTLPELARAVLKDAAHSPCVLLVVTAAAALRDHPSAVHVRLRASLEWRIASYAREHLLDRAAAEHAVKHDDHVKRTWLKTLYDADIDDERLYSLVLDASRFSVERLVAILLAAG